MDFEPGYVEPCHFKLVMVALALIALVVLAISL